MSSRPIPFLRDQDEQRRFQNGCLGKEAFPSESAAAAIIAERKKAKDIRRKHLLQSYRCEFCKDWHIGHSSGGGE
jgi:hypothetical protein